MLKFLWTCWLSLTAAGAGWLFRALPGDSPPSSASVVFLPGETTNGHHQIETNCAVCHRPDAGVTDQSCIDCHDADLKQSRDTHARSKFNDPKKADLLQHIDATNCLSCHIEHQEEQTDEIGVTVPADYCFHCHQDVAKTRPSHTAFAFDSCATAGCHNYHDNTALYENFLHKHSGQTAITQNAANPLRKLQQWLLENSSQNQTRLAKTDTNAPVEWQYDDIIEEWAAGPHALVGVNCSECHMQNVNGDPDDGSAGGGGDWISNPTHQACSQCHQAETDGFLSGKHGMRLLAGLSEMTPELARLSMHSAAGHKSLNCTACHSAHHPDPDFAAFDACISCHDDNHTRNYFGSSHFQVWQSELRGETEAGTGVSCATCHMPRNKDGTVQHNQNQNLRPNEKMIRTVCMNCHGLQFALDALADPALKENCFSTPPKSTVHSVQMVNDWFESKNKQ